MSAAKLIFLFTIIGFCSGGETSERNVTPNPVPSVTSTPDGTKYAFPVSIIVSHAIDSKGPLPVTTVTWQVKNVEDSSAYRYLFYVIVCNPKDVCHIYNTNRTTLQPTGFQYWTRYTIRVIAVNRTDGYLHVAGVGKQSVYTGEGAPFAPVSLHADLAYPTSVFVSWANPKSTSSKKITLYEVCVTSSATNGTCAYNRTVQFHSGGYQEKFENILPATTYRIEVRSVIRDISRGAVRDYSSEPVNTSVTTGAHGYKPFSSLNYNISEANGSAAVVLTWKTPDDDTGKVPEHYVFEVCEKSSCTTKLARGSATELQLEGVDYWSTIAVKAYAMYMAYNGEEVLSLVNSIEFKTGPGRPKKPTLLRAQPMSETAVFLIWVDAPTGGMYPTKYQVRACPESGDCRSIDMTHNGSSIHETVLNKLTPGMGYAINVSAVIVDEGKRYESVPAESRVTMPKYGYVKVNNMAYTLSQGTGSVNITLTWDVPEDGTTRTPSRFLFKVCDGGTCSSHEVTGTRTLTLIDVDYWTVLRVTCYAVYDINGAIILSEKEETSVKTGPGSPRIPTFTAVSALGPTSAFLSWACPDKTQKYPTKYVIETCEQKAVCRNITHAKTESNSCTAVVHNLRAETNYTFRIHAVIVEGMQTYSGLPREVSLTTPGYENSMAVLRWKNPDLNDTLIRGCTISLLRNSNSSDIVFNVTTISEAGAISRLIPWTQRQGGCSEWNGSTEKPAVAVESAEVLRSSLPSAMSTPTVILICVIAIICGVSIIGFLTYKKLQKNKKVSVLRDAEEMDNRSDARNDVPDAWNTNFLFYEK